MQPLASSKSSAAVASAGYRVLLCMERVDSELRTTLAFQALASAQGNQSKQDECTKLQEQQKAAITHIGDG